MTLSDLINAQKLDRLAYRTAVTRYQKMRENLTQFLSPEKDMQTSYEAFNSWLTEYDELRAEAYARGGECEKLLDQMNTFRDEIKTFITAAAEQGNPAQELMKLLPKLFTIGDDFYKNLTSSKLAIQIRLIENSSDIAPYIITSENIELNNLREAMGLDGGMAELLEQFVHELFFKLKANSLEDGTSKLKFLFDKVKVMKGLH